MNESTLPIYSCLTGFAIFFVVVISVLAYKNNNLTKSKKIKFIIAYSLVGVCALSEWGQYAISAFGYINNDLYATLKTIEFIACPFIGYFIGTMFSDEGKSKYVQFAVLGANTIVEIVNGFTRFIYHFDENGKYSHGTFYFIYLIFYMWSILFCVIQGFRMMTKYRFKNWYQLIFIAVCLLTQILVQSLTKIWIDFFILAVCGFMVYIFMTELMQQSDAVTGLYNRRTFDVKMEDLSQNAIIAVLDVDKFKLCNDLYGHSYGDEVLERIGKKIYECFHAYGKCFRIGGDEFSVIITKKLDDADKAFEKFDNEINAIKASESKFPTVSFGYAKFTPQADSSILVFNLADKDMYSRKAARKEKEKLENTK